MPLVAGYRPGQAVGLRPPGQGGRRSDRLETHAGQEPPRGRKVDEDPRAGPLS